MNLFVFGEGKTELYVMEAILKQGWKCENVKMQRDRARKLSIILSDVTFGRAITIKETGGKSFNEQSQVIENALSVELEQGVQCLILADRDSGETVQGLQTRYEHLFQAVLKRRNIVSDVVFQVVEGNENVFFYQTPPELPDIRCALHIAQAPIIPVLEEYTFQNTTTDDYILAMALTDGVLRSFAQDAGKGQEQPIEAEILRRKVVQEIPSLLKENGYENLDAKDYNAIYMMVARFLKNTVSEANATFVKALMGRATSIKDAQQEFERIFASHIAAIKLLQQEETAI
jgi:hypothetical protein